MALIVEDGTGLIDAVSYIDLADAVEYARVMPTEVTSAWDALNDPAKEALLIYATRVLDQRTIWEGRKYAATSALRWPRMYVVDRDSLPVDHNAVPQPVKSAVVELALWFSNPGRNPLTFADSQGIESLKVDVIAITYKAAHDASTLTQFPPGLNTLLYGIGTFQYGNRTFATINKA